MASEEKGKKKKTVSVEQASNGWIVHCYDREYGGNAQTKVFRDVDELTKWVADYLKK